MGRVKMCTHFLNLISLSLTIEIFLGDMEGTLVFQSEDFIATIGEGEEWHLYQKLIDFVHFWSHPLPNVRYR